MENKYIRNVSTLKLEDEKCIGCGMCAAVCPHQLLFMQDGKSAVRDKDMCMECGACAKNCPTSAISVECGVGCAVAVLNGLFRKSSPECESGSIFKKRKGCC
ncbi:MAG TPA: mercury methylation ferredoxin HgcB [Clostridia bacterium]|nr:mercury methylation ferredoxin HgcB [Clostridia bacterium]